MKTHVMIATRRRARAFASGLATGLSAPALLMSGEFEIVHHRKAANISQQWRDVGKFIRASAEQYGRRQRVPSA